MTAGEATIAAASGAVGAPAMVGMTGEAAVVTLVVTGDMEGVTAPATIETGEIEIVDMGKSYLHCSLLK